ncbi:MAG: ATP-binding protein [Byssovorax sp.]
MIRRTFAIDSDLGRVAALAGEVSEACRSMHIAAADAILVEICVVEAVNNAIEHAYREEPGHRVFVDLALDGERVTLEVRDRGARLCESKLASARCADPTIEPLDSLPERGMGLAIMKEAMERVAYTCAGGINTLSLSRRVALTAGPSAPR